MSTMTEAEGKRRKRMRSELRSDLRDGYCCVCENELPTEGARVVKSARVLGLGKVSLPNCFSVCKERCAKFLGSTDKLKRPPQRLLLRRMSVALFGTCVLVDDRVRIIRDMSANRKVQAGEGTVHNIVESSSSSSISVLDSERGSLLLQSPGRLRAEILVKMAVGGGVVRVWPSGLSRISDDDADDDARRPHPVKAVPNNVLAERCQNQLARIEELKASRDAQKQRAVGADAARRTAAHLRNELSDAAHAAREQEERCEAQARTA